MGMGSDSMGRVGAGRAAAGSTFRSVRAGPRTTEGVFFAVILRADCARAARAPARPPSASCSEEKTWSSPAGAKTKRAARFRCRAIECKKTNSLAGACQEKSCRHPTPCKSFSPEGIREPESRAGRAGFWRRSRRAARGGRHGSSRRGGPGREESGPGRRSGPRAQKQSGLSDDLAPPDRAAAGQRRRLRALTGRLAAESPEAGANFGRSRDSWARR